MALDGGEVNAGNVVHYLPVGLYSTRRNALRRSLMHGSGHQRTARAQRVAMVWFGHRLASVPPTTKGHTLSYTNQV